MPGPGDLAGFMARVEEGSGRWRGLPCPRWGSGLGSRLGILVTKRRRWHCDNFHSLGFKVLPVPGALPKTRLHPQFSSSFGAPRAIPKLPGFECRWDSSPRFQARAPTPLRATGRAPSHLATAAAAPEAHCSRRLHWRRSPRSRGCSRGVLRGGTLRWGRGQGLPDRDFGHWLAEAALIRPIAAQGRDLPPGGLSPAGRAAGRRV